MTSTSKTALTLSLFYLGLALLFTLALLGIFYLDPLRSALSVYFYRGLTYILLAALLLACAACWLTKKIRRTRPDFSWANACCVTLCGLSIMTCFFVLVPMSLDRSISVLMLCYAQKADRPLSAADFNALYQKLYVDAYDPIGRRLHEQEVSGNLTPTAQGYVTTAQARAFVRTVRFLGRIFSTGTAFIDPPLLPAVPAAHEQASTEARP